MSTALSLRRQGAGDEENRLSLIMDTTGSFLDGGGDSSFITTMPRTRRVRSEIEDGFQSVHDLHHKFELAISSMPSRLQVFEIVDEWMIYIEKALRVPRHLDSDISESAHQKLHTILNREYETWDLIKTLYLDRLTDQENEKPVPFDQPIYDKYHLNEKSYAEAVVRGDKSLQELDAILCWLELNYSRKGDPDLTEKYVVWEQTLETLKRDQLLGKQSNASMVSKIDPDATTREKKQLHPLDAEEELRIQRGTFHYLRTGNFEKALAFLNESGHIAKASALFGSCHSKIESLTEEDEGFVGTRSIPTASEYPLNSGLQPRSHPNFIVDGNSDRDLWKSIAWKICEKKGVSKWERAVIGTSCHHRQSMLDVAQTWEDKLWSYIKTSVAVQVEEKVRDHNVAHNHIKLPSEYWSQGLSLPQIFEKLESTLEAQFDIEYLFQLLQKCVMLDRLDIFLDILQRNVEGLFDSIEHVAIYDHIVRFLTHVLLIFAILNLPYKEDLTNIMSEAYIRVLVKSQRFLNIPFYVQKLSFEVQIPVIVSQLNPDQPLSGEQKRMFLESAAENELDVLGIGVAIVEKMRDELQSFDISTLQWIMYCHPLVEQSNLVMLEFLRYTIWIARKYLTLGDIEKVKKLIRQITPECIDEVLSVSEDLKETLVREYICYREYLEGEEALVMWKKAKSQKPSFGDPAEPILGSLADKALWTSKKQEFESARSKWLSAVDFHAKTAIDRFMEILKFPGGWLRDCCDPSDEDESVHTNAVRRIIIKKVTYVLLNLVKERRSAQTFKEFIYVLCEGHRKILEEFSPIEIGGIFKVVEEFTRASCPNLMNLPK